jgi:hypothetical protein
VLWRPDKVGDIHNPPTSCAVTITLLYIHGDLEDEIYATQVALRVDVQNLLPRDYWKYY